MSKRIDKTKQCETFLRYNEFGIKVMKPKKKYATDEEAIKQARWMNTKPETIRKYIAYKCNNCHHWHIGKGDKILTDKERERYKKNIMMDKIMNK